MPIGHRRAFRVLQPRLVVLTRRERPELVGIEDDPEAGRAVHHAGRRMRTRRQRRRLQLPVVGDLRLGVAHEDAGEECDQHDRRCGRPADHGDAVMPPAAGLLRLGGEVEGRARVHDGLHHVLFETGAGLGPRRRIGEQVGQKGDLGGLARVQRPGAAPRDQLPAFYLRHALHHEAGSRRCPSSAASLVWARCDLDLTVPTAMPSLAAISV